MGAGGSLVLTPAWATPPPEGPWTHGEHESHFQEWSLPRLSLGAEVLGLPCAGWRAQVQLCRTPVWEAL